MRVLRSIVAVSRTALFWTPSAGATPPVWGLQPGVLQLSPEPLLCSLFRSFLTPLSAPWYFLDLFLLLDVAVPGD